MLVGISGSWAFGWLSIDPLGRDPCCQSWQFMHALHAANKWIGQPAGALAVMLIVWCTLADPGWVRASDAPEEVPASWDRCTVHHCGLIRPPGSHHCRECDACVAGFDHHCSWLGVCIGKHNRGPFIALLASGGVSWLLLGVASIQAAWIRFDWSHFGWWVLRSFVGAWFHWQAGTYLVGSFVLQLRLLRRGSTQWQWTKLQNKSFATGGATCVPIMASSPHRAEESPVSEERGALLPA